MSSKRSEKLVIVGNGPVGYWLCRRLVDFKFNLESEIVVFGEEKRPAYDRVHLTEYFTGRTADDLEFAPKEWYSENQIQLHTGDPVKFIDRENKTVRTQSGFEAEYDNLVLTTGSSPFVPPIEGIDLPAVHVYRTIDDLSAIREEANNHDSAVVMGGGLLGLEAAKALYDSGLKTTIVEMAPSLMPRQLDSEGAKLLAKKIEKLGVDIKLIHRTEKVSKTNSGIKIHFKDHEPLESGLLVISTGIRPRDELARKAKLEVGERGGIVVNGKLQTSDTSIFAAGECASHHGIIYGLVAPGYLMAEIIAENFCGENRVFEGSDFSAQLKLMGVEVSSIGAFLETGDDVEFVSAQQNSTYCKLILKRGRLIGTISVGPNSELPRLQESINQNRRIYPWQKRRFEKTCHVWPNDASKSVSNWPSGAVVCSCMKITRGTLSEACNTGCKTIDELAETTQASTVCGSCKPLLSELLGEQIEHQPLPGSRILVFVSAISLLIVGLTFWLKPPAVAQSVLEAQSFLNTFIRDDFWKQVTGYSLLGLTILALSLSLRKRIRIISFGDFAWWRVLHSTLGMLTLFGLIMHTGWSLGDNLNAVLMVTFLALNVLGAVTAVFTSIESKTTGSSAVFVRKWRPWLTQLHIWTFWPFPVLVAFHIFSFYYYG